MKHLSQGVKVGILAIIMVVGSYAVWKTIGSQPSGESNIGLGARFRDASGLPMGSRVVVAGLPVGEISTLGIEGRYALVSFRMRDDIPVWSNAVVYKKSSSLLGDYYLEIDPGAPESLDASGVMIKNRQLEPGDLIPTVEEGTSPDELMRRIEDTMPNVDKVLLSVRDLSEDLRRVVNGPLASVADRIDTLVQTEADTVSTILSRADRSMANIEAITNDIRSLTGGKDNQVERILDRLEEASTEARELVVSARQEVEQTGTKVREKLDQVDELLASSASVAKKIDGDQGTLGRLVNDSTIADNVEDITEDAKGFLGGLLGMQTYVGLRSEYNMLSGLTRHYVTVELATRPDKSYYIELEKGPRGGYPAVTLEYDPAVDRNSFTRKVLIEDKIRFTFQIAKRFGWATFRYGLKESTGGVGFDVATSWLGRGLQIQSDLFDATFDRLPRLKVTAAYELFHFLYILGGIDDALNAGGELVIDPGPAGLEVPIQFEEFRYGRDVFAGAMLRFNDRDLATLLTVGGSAVASAVE